MRRQKKATSLQLNFVQHNAKKKSISVQKVSYPFDAIAGSSNANSSSSTSFKPLISSSVSPAIVDFVDD